MYFQTECSTSRDTKQLDRYAACIRDTPFTCKGPLTSGCNCNSESQVRAKFFLKNLYERWCCSSVASLSFTLWAQQLNAVFKVFWSWLPASQPCPHWGQQGCWLREAAGSAWCGRVAWASHWNIAQGNRDTESCFTAKSDKYLMD